MQKLQYHELANMFPMMSADEKAELKAGIEMNGFDESHPIILFEGMILDGRNRYEVAQELGIDVPLKEYEGNDPVNFVIQENLYRRHLETGQKAMIAVDIKKMWQKYNPQGRPMKENEKAGNFAWIDSNSQNRDIAGKQIGVSGRYVDEAESIKNRDEKVAEHVKQGNINIPTAKALTELEQEDREEILNLIQKDNLSNKEIQQITKEKRLKAQGVQSSKVAISLYGDNIYFSHVEASDKRWDDHIIDKPEYPTLTRWSRFYHPDRTEFSLREYARVQDFPDEFKFVGTYQQIKDQIGNAVSPFMAEYVGKQLQGHTFIDLFAGCGGLSVGLEKLGKKGIYAIERARDYAQTFIVNFPDCEMVINDIQNIDINTIPDADIIVGGPPCQGFSKAGLRLKNDPRNQLYKEFLRIVEAKKPKEFLMENVPDIEMIKDQIIEDFSQIGYTVTFTIIKGEEIGMKEKRHRAFFIGKL